jgi:hypothetical protein
MSLALVLPGNHRQYVQGVSEQLDRGNTDAPRAREVLGADQLRGYSGEDVDELYLIGTYAKDNSAWMSSPYEILMHEGLRAGKAWAMDINEDVRRAYDTPVPPEQMAATRARLQALEQELSE